MQQCFYTTKTRSRHLPEDSRAAQTGIRLQNVSLALKICGALWLLLLSEFSRS